jgi:hypothetical protein
MQQKTEPGCLVMQPGGFAIRPSMNIGMGALAHDFHLIDLITWLILWIISQDVLTGMKILINVSRMRGLSF